MKKKISVEEFVSKYFVPTVDGLVESVADLLLQEISQNVPKINTNKNQIEFESFILFTYTAGRSLGKIKAFEKGYNSPLLIKFNKLIDGILADYDGVEINRMWIKDTEQTVNESALHQYYVNKTKAYREYEVAYSKSEMAKDDFEMMISAVFLSTNGQQVNDHLMDAISEAHRVSYTIWDKTLTAFSKKCNIS